MPGIPSSKYRVLHIDDNPEITRIIAARLSQCGITVTSLNDPTMAVELLLREQFQVVLLDVDMPNVNGLDLLDEINRLDGGIKVILVTGRVSMTTVLRAMRHHAAACFFLPMEDVEPLASAIRSAFDNLDRWWDTLKQLAEFKRRETHCLEAHS